MYMQFVTTHERVKGMQNDKSPGLDGFPAERYKFFWQDIKNCLYINIIKKVGTFSSDLEEAMLETGESLSQNSKISSVLEKYN